MEPENPYVRPLPEIGDWLERIHRAALSTGFSVEDLAWQAGHPVRAYRRMAPASTNGESAPSVYVSAGIHGDEPSGVATLREFLEQDRFRHDVGWFLCPCLNPGGLALGTREAPDGVDLNRDYRQPRTDLIRAHVAWLENAPAFDWVACLHEDWESQGFYLYEKTRGDTPLPGKRVIEAVRPQCLVDESERIDGLPASGGVINIPDYRNDPKLRNQWAEAIYLFEKKADRVFTFESPSAHALEKRVAAHAAALEVLQKIGLA